MQFRVGVEENVGKQWKFKQAVEGYWLLASSNDNFYASSGAISVPAHPGASRHIENELDLVAEYTLNKRLNFGFGYALLFAGQFLKTATPGLDYSYSFAHLEYDFSKSGFHFPTTPNKPDQQQLGLEFEQMSSGYWSPNGPARRRRSSWGGYACAAAVAGRVN